MIYRSLFLITSIAIYTLLISCEPPTEAETTGSIEGLVYDESNNNTLSNVLITTSPTTETAVTDQSGKYLLEDMEAGTYTVFAVLDDYKHNSATIDVKVGKKNYANLFLVPEVPEIAILPENIDFGTTQTSISFFISNSGVGSFTWTLTENINWLSASKTSGIVDDTPVEISVSVTRADLDYGNYQGIITIQSTAGNVFIPVHLANSNPNAPQLSVFPLNLEFQDNESEKIVTISNTGTGDLTWDTADIPNWVILTPESGSISSGSTPLTVGVNRAQLASGVHSESFSINSNGGTSTIELTVHVAEVPTLSVDMSDLIFESSEFQKEFNISNTGSGTLEWNLAVSHDWINVNPTSGSNESTITVTTDHTGLVGGNYDGSVFVSSNGGNFTISINIFVPGDDPPSASTLLNPFDIGESSIKLQWTRNADPDFQAYKIYRSFTSGVDESSTLIATISSSVENMKEDLNLLPNTTYHYKVFTVDQANQSVGSNEVSATTLRDLGSWSVMADLGNNLSGVDMYSSTFGYAVGAYGGIFFWNGSSWQQESSTLTTSYLYDIKIVSPNDIWVVGRDGTLIHFDGVNWSLIPDIPYRDMYKVEVIGDQVWFCSEYGFIYSYNKTSGSLETYDLPVSSFYTFQMMNSDVGFALDVDGKLFRYNGFGWSLFDELEDRTYYDTQLDESGNGWIVSSSASAGISYLQDGTQNNYTSGTFRAVEESDGIAWFIGDGGKIVWYNPDTQSIENYSSPTTSELLELVFLDNGVGFAVGESGIVLIYTN